MKPQPTHEDGAEAEFTAGEHLHVQFAIEDRAREIWIQGGYRPNVSLENWLQAEQEVTEGFIRKQSGTNGRSGQAASNSNPPPASRNHKR